MDRRNVLKRKRSSVSTSASISSSARHNHPSDTINPLSHTPSTLHQLLTAGLSEVDNLPSIYQPGFPHQPWRDPTSTTKPRRRRRRKDHPPSRTDTESGTDTETDIDPETEPDSGASGPASPSSTAELPGAKSYAAERAALRPLANSIRTFLSRGDIPAAKRAFGLLMRSKVSGKPVDIRRNHYWELGAEILMRERAEEEERKGGQIVEQGEEQKRRRHQLLYPLSNVPKVREYFETLIRRYPHHLGARRAASALQFYPALINYEILQVHTRLTISLADLDAEAEGWDSSHQGDGEDDHHERGPGYSPGVYFHDEDPELDPTADPFDLGTAILRPRHPEDRVHRARDGIYNDTIGAMRSLAAQMDRRLEDATFIRSAEMWRLRGTVSLYIADLLALRHAAPAGQPGRETTSAERAAEMEAARTFFLKMVECGGRLDAAVRTAVGMDEEDSDQAEEEMVLPAFSSLLIRDGRPGG
ncbi:hypothetical protein ACRALDRAFT_1070291 [Sodiomyces alcalophilus JCM 7366]|uniref:uncharacterized protein n=1 Tax=Sodiomyces alcalophilus JCM 7366 TaxID=591952 RepID=UPI0039B41056